VIIHLARLTDPLSLPIVGFVSAITLAELAVVPAIAVTLNNRTDNFGQDMDIAAGVQGLADAKEVSFSAAVMEAPGVDEIVNPHYMSQGYDDLKGVGQQMELYRLTIAPARIQG
jgi:class 3 adenylate cyclase